LVVVRYPHCLVDRRPEREVYGLAAGDVSEPIDWNDPEVPAGYRIVEGRLVEGRFVDRYSTAD